jgi:hypothetical protein
MTTSTTLGLGIVVALFGACIGSLYKTGSNLSRGCSSRYQTDVYS